MPTVAAIHTAMPMVEPTKELFTRLLPGIRLINITDDSLIQDVIAAGKVPQAVATRLFQYYRAAVHAGADVIFNTCSSVGDVALEARKELDIPLVKIDDAMAREAVEKASSIGVLATLQTTLDPTIRLLEQSAEAAGKRIRVSRGVAEGAFQAVIGGDRETHDRLIMETAEKLAPEVELFVLAQGSMARMEESLSAATGLPVLSSPERGVLEVKQVLDSLKK